MIYIENFHAIDGYNLTSKHIPLPSMGPSVAAWGGVYYKR
jgi:hypothetical protein